MSLELCLAPIDALANEESTRLDGTGSGASSSPGNHDSNLRSNSSSSLKNISATWTASVAVPGLSQCEDNQLSAFLEFGGHGDVLHLAFPSCLWPTPAQHDTTNGDDDAFVRSSSRLSESTSNTGISGIVVALQPWFVPKSSSSLPRFSPDNRYGRSSISESATSRQSDVWSRGIASPPIMVALAPQRHFESREPLTTITTSSSERSGDSSASNDNNDIISGYLNSGVPSSRSHQHAGVHGPAELTAATLALNPNLLAEQPLPVRSSHTRPIRYWHACGACKQTALSPSSLSSIMFCLFC